MNVIAFLFNASKLSCHVTSDKMGRWNQWWFLYTEGRYIERSLNNNGGVGIVNRLVKLQKDILSNRKSFV